MDNKIQNQDTPSEKPLGLVKTVGIWAAMGVGFEALTRSASGFKPVFQSRALLKAATGWGLIGMISVITTNMFGLNKNENQGNVLRNLSAGAAFGAAATAVDDVFQRRKVNIRNVGLWAGISAAAYGISALFNKRKPVIPTDTIIGPITPPAQPVPVERTLAVAQVPQILDMLVAEQKITPEQKETVLADIKSGTVKGFAGEIAVAKHFISKEQLEESLAIQGQLKTEAAINDIRGLSQEHGAYKAPLWLKANWGNHGVNPAAQSPTRIDGISAAANNAQNLVMLAYANPHREVLPIIQEGIIAAANLSRGIASGNSAQVPIAKMAESWIDSMNNALVVASQANPERMVDANGQPVDVHAFIAARNAEIGAAVQQTLQNSQNRDNGQTR